MKFIINVVGLFVHPISCELQKATVSWERLSLKHLLNFFPCVKVMIVKTRLLVSL